MKKKSKVEKAKIGDVPQLHRLIKHFADQGEMLHRPLSEIYENIRDYFVVRRGPEVLGCVALHVAWGDMAEIKALAVAAERQERGIGAALVRICIEEAKQLDLPTLFCLTYKPAFFRRFGFRQVDLMSLPRKVWGECQRCPKFPSCDETAMVLPLKEPEKEGKAAVGEERTLETERVYQGQLVGLRVDTVELPGGRRTQREIVEHGECVAIVALEGEEVLLLRQYRKAVEEALLEIPAGGLEPEEEPLQCAQRELQEETGYSAGRMERIGGFYTSPGYTTEFMHLYLATDLRPAPTAPAADESLEVLRVPLSQIPELIASGQIRDAKSIAGLLTVISRGIP